MKFIKRAFKSYVENPLIIVFFILQYLVALAFSFNSKLTFYSPIIEYSFLVLFSVVFLVVSSFFLSLFIGSAYLAINNKFSFRRTFKYSKYTFGNVLFLIWLAIWTVAFFLLANLFGYITYRISFGNIAFFLSTGTFIFGLLVLVLFSFNNLFYTLKNKSLFQSVVLSVKTVWKNYLYILGIIVCFIVVDYLTSFIPYLLAKDIIDYVIIYPILTLILVSLFEDVSGK